MSNQDIILDVVNSILQDKNTIDKKALPAVICNLLRPFSKQKLSHDVEANINKLVLAHGICSKCRNGKLKVSSDLFCVNCKRVLKDKAKKTIH